MVLRDLGRAVTLKAGAQALFDLIAENISDFQ
jgi:hypothetical protein